MHHKALICMKARLHSCMLQRIMATCWQPCVAVVYCSLTWAVPAAGLPSSGSGQLQSQAGLCAVLPTHAPVLQRHHLPSVQDRPERGTPTCHAYALLIACTTAASSSLGHQQLVGLDVISRINLKLCRWCWQSGRLSARQTGYSWRLSAADCGAALAGHPECWCRLPPCQRGLTPSRDPCTLPCRCSCIRNLAAVSPNDLCQL